VRALILRGAILPAALLAALLAARPAAALCGDPAGGNARPHFERAGRAPAAPSAAGRTAVLTFDAAWASEGATEILDALAARGVRATFFLAGRFVRAHPEIARRIAAEGHEAGNHTFRHDHLTRYGIDGTRGTLPGVDAALLGSEMAQARRAWESATGLGLASIWRAPYGEVNDEILEWGRGAGYEHVGWSEGLDALDWVSDTASPLYRSPAAELSRLLGRLGRRPVGGGAAVILMHLGSERPEAERFVRVLPSLIEGARALGYRFMTAGEALRAGTLP
jgi:peptidoglycan/xylan/chitin deacetylase (PgdA/CDA1 family)